METKNEHGTFSISRLCPLPSHQRPCLCSGNKRVVITFLLPADMERVCLQPLCEPCRPEARSHMTVRRWSYGAPGIGRFLKINHSSILTITQPAADSVQNDDGQMSDQILSYLLVLWFKSSWFKPSFDQILILQCKLSTLYASYALSNNANMLMFISCNVQCFHHLILLYFNANIC